MAGSNDSFSSALSLVSRGRPLPREKGSGDNSIPNPYRWNADMSCGLRNWGQVEEIVMMCGQYTALVRSCSAVFFLWLQFFCVPC